MNLDVIANREAISTACEHVRTSHEKCPWVVVGYSDFSPHPGVLTLDIMTSGTTWKEFLLSLHIDKIMYAYLKLDAAIVDRSFTPGTVFVLLYIHWTGRSVSTNEKLICIWHSEKICELLGEYVCKLTCSSVVDILTNIEVLDCKDSFLRFKASRLVREKKSKENLRDIPTEQVRISISILGDCACGKSTFVAFINTGYFNPNSFATIGFGRTITRCYYKEIRYKLIIYDNMGLDLSYPSIPYTISVRRSKGIVLFYDITNRNTFLNIRERMVLVRKHTDPSICIMLLGNKLDLADRRDVTFEEGENLARELGIDLFFEISVRNNINVKDAWHAFNLLTYINFNKEVSDRQGTEDVIGLGINNTPQRESCCK